MEERYRQKRKPIREAVSPSPGEKLKTEQKSREAVRAKFRHGKKSHVLTPEEGKRTKFVKERGRKQIRKEAAIAVTSGQMLSEANQDENTGAESVSKSMEVAEATASHVKRNKYAGKLHEKKETKQSEEREEKTAYTSKEMQRKQYKKQVAERAQKDRGKTTKKTGYKNAVAGKNTGDIFEKVNDFLKKQVTEKPGLFLIFGVVAVIILLITTGFSSCGMMSGGIENVTIITTFTAEDEDILAVEEDYKAMENALSDTLSQIERDYPDYDEYRYYLDEINHNPYELAALLTVLFEDYTRAEVQEMLQTIFDAQYELTFNEIVKIRTKEEEVVEFRPMWDPETQSVVMVRYTYISQIEYEYYILEVTLENKTMEAVVSEMNLTSDQLERYEILLQTYGNKPYLFGGDIYSKEDAGDYEDYEIPPEYLTDQEFARMIQCAEQYLGMAYVWGGSSPSTGFDCSGFVSYVINHSNNGWNVGRQTANGLLNSCTRVSSEEVKPGDLVFFQGTYNVSGASHVGIYVGDGMMIHCGNPIQYTSIVTSYWQNHFYTYGRING